MVDGDGAAATVGADGGARGASGSNSEILGIYDTTAGSHDTARIVFGGFDGGVGNVDRGAVGSAVISSGGTAVAEDAIGAGGVGGDCGVFDVEGCAIFGDDGGVGAIETSIVAAVRVAGLGDGDV